MMNIILSIAGVFGLRRYVENYFLKKLSEAFGSQEPLSTSFADAYPAADGIEDFPQNEVAKDIVAELVRTGSVSLASGVYDFFLEGFCLRAGAYAPVKGDGYPAAPVKGSKSEVISAVLSGSSKHAEVSQQAVQTLLWAVEAGVKYTAIKGDARRAADIILSAEHKGALGKSFWDTIPVSLQNLITDAMLERLPSSVRSLLTVYRNVKTRIELGSSYSEVERVAVLFNPPQSVAGAAKAGTWTSMPGGYCARAFPSGYTSGRLQVYVPPASAPARFSCGDFILTPADTSRQRLGLRLPPQKPDMGVEIVFKDGERLSNPDVIEALKKLAEMLGADKVRVSDGDRTLEEFMKIYPDRKPDAYRDNPHGSEKGHIAADCQFFKNGEIISHDKAADAAALIKDIGGIGLYDKHIHIDLRPRLPGDIPTRWKGDSK